MPSAHCWSNTTLSRNASRTSLYFYFDKQRREVLKTIKKLTIFEFFCWLQYYWCQVNFCNPYLWYLIRSERCTPIVRHCNFRLCWIFILINKVEGSTKYLRNLKIFNFFIVDAMFSMMLLLMLCWCYVFENVFR